MKVADDIELGGIIITKEERNTIWEELSDSEME